MIRIATWFVSDDADTATFFPQVGARSDAPEAQAVYWRCAAVFYASSIAVNPHARHVFYTNCHLPVVDGIDLGDLFSRWGVEVVHLPITYRLQKDRVGSWGNQFYVFDVIDHLATDADDRPTILLDSDCVWRRPVDELALAIETEGLIAYRLEEDEHAAHEAINGLSRAGMARFLARNGGPQRDATPYYGGEIYAARADVSRAIAARMKELWPQVLAGAANAPREEAHMLSIIYAIEGIENDAAGKFIRRMWTTFRRNNLRPADADLALWHLPAEKRTGFADLYAAIARQPSLHPAQDAVALGLTDRGYARAMGFPRRSPHKLVRDLSLKIAEKLGA